MKDKHVFFNPFRLISPKLDREASRLEELYESPPAEMTCLEEGLLVMLTRLTDMATLAYKCLIIADPEKIKKCDALGREIHDEEKQLTGDLVCSPATTGETLKTLVLFPGHLERVGDYLESIINCASVKARDGIPFSDKAHAELTELFGLLSDILKDIRETLAINNWGQLDTVREKQRKLAQMTLDFALAHEDRLLEGLCSPKASSLYLDILDSAKGANERLVRIVDSLLKLEKGSAAA
jgi:Na+/phosphate symporter